jgi:hypothetical protein
MYFSKSSIINSLMILFLAIIATSLFAEKRVETLESDFVN